MNEARRRGKRNQRRGKAAERAVAKYLGGRRVPLSGGLGGDLVGDVKLPQGFRVEVKRRQGLPPKRLMDWLAGVDMLVLLGPHQPVAQGLVVMRVQLLKEVLRSNGSTTDP